MLGALFLSAFTSATLLPGTSEVALAAVVALGTEPNWIPVVVATAGNSLGGLSTFWVGWWIHGSVIRLNSAHRNHPTTLRILNRFGPVSLAFSWVPVIGDGLVLAAGFLRIPGWPCFFWMVLGKAARYVGILAMLTGSA